MSGSVSGLSFEQRIEARDLTIAGAKLMLRNSPAIHYTQGPLRWQGIDHHLRTSKGQFPTYADCSSSTTFLLWQGLGHFGVGDIVNGQGWRSGYTGTQLTHGKQVEHRANWRRCDLFLYGNGWPGEHVAMYMGDGLVFSHGSERGPMLLPWNYRSDLMQVRRYI